MKRTKEPKSRSPRKPRPKMWDQEEDPVKTKSMKNENRLAKTLGVGTTPGSGNLEWPSLKGDLSHPSIMFEAKETKHASISVNAGVIGTICRQAAVTGKDPALILSAYNLPEPLPQEWVCVPLGLFAAMLRDYDG